MNDVILIEEIHITTYRRISEHGTMHHAEHAIKPPRHSVDVNEDVLAINLVEKVGKQDPTTIAQQ